MLFGRDTQEVVDVVEPVVLDEQRMSAFVSPRPLLQLHEFRARHTGRRRESREIDACSKLLRAGQ